MKLALILLGSLSLFELAIWLPTWRRLNRFFAPPLTLVLPIVGIAVFVAHPKAWTGLITLLCVYRAFNLVRYWRAHTNEAYAWKHGRQAAVWLIAAQLLLVALMALDTDNHELSTYFWLLLFGQATAATIIVCSFIRQRRKTAFIEAPDHYADRDLPSVTVAIPARNETTDLEACLQSLVASNYPKLEILVLDDCSQNKRTPEIIQAYAHAGVRFIAGKTPPKKWLSKNYAYQQLAEQASGELLLFCGVDIRFEPQSMRSIVTALVAKDKSILSIVPRNKRPEGIIKLIVQPTRYAWEMTLPRRLFNRPPVLSSCWLVSSDLLQHAGGFAAVSNSISPESYFAKRAIEARDGYSFVRSTPELGVHSEKNFEDQYETAVRTRYPQLHRRVELVALLAVLQVSLLVLPFPFFLASLATGAWQYVIPSGVICLLLAYTYCGVTTIAYQQFLFRSLFLLPFSALFDVGLLHYSMWKYEFGAVIWKERNVCLPVMTTYTHLPKID